MARGLATGKIFLAEVHELEVYISGVNGPQIVSVQFSIRLFGIAAFISVRLNFLASKTILFCFT